jgi:hypothetical protein
MTTPRDNPTDAAGSANSPAAPASPVNAALLTVTPAPTSVSANWAAVVPSDSALIAHGAAEAGLGAPTTPPAPTTAMTIPKPIRSRDALLAVMPASLTAPLGAASA